MAIPPAALKCRYSHGRPSPRDVLQHHCHLLHSMTPAQELDHDADVQRLKQRRQNLMYQVAALQLQKVSGNCMCILIDPHNQ